MVLKLANLPIVDLKNYAWKAVETLLMSNAPAARRDD
jgi:hypothetical protein